MTDDEMIAALQVMSAERRLAILKATCVVDVKLLTASKLRDLVKEHAQLCWKAGNVAGSDALTNLLVEIDQRILT